jgi:hypothetical protein
MQRPWVVRPAPGEIEVEDDAIVASLLEASAILKRCGGVLTVIVQREEGDFPGEMFTTAAVFQWKDRTDAKPQPETRQQILPPRCRPTRSRTCWRSTSPARSGSGRL